MATGGGDVTRKECPQGTASCCSPPTGAAAVGLHARVATSELAPAFGTRACWRVWQSPSWRRTTAAASVTSFPAAAAQPRAPPCAEAPQELMQYDSLNQLIKL